MNNYNVKYNRPNAVYENKDWDAWEKEWDRRKNTEFGKLLNKLNEIVFDWFGEYDEYGFKSTPISEIILDYFDGENDLEGLINDIKRVLENYDMMQEDDIRKIINRLNRIAGNNKDKDLLESLVEKYGVKGVEAAINRLNESTDYDYDENSFNPKDCLTWLIKTGLLDRFNSSYDINEWAEMAQYAAEDAGVPLDDAERVYDVAFMKYAR